MICIIHLSLLHSKNLHKEYNLVLISPLQHTKCNYPELHHNHYINQHKNCIKIINYHRRIIHYKCHSSELSSKSPNITYINLVILSSFNTYHYILHNIILKDFKDCRKLLSNLNCIQYNLAIKRFQAHNLYKNPLCFNMSCTKVHMKGINLL